MSEVHVVRTVQLLSSIWFYF